MILVGAIHLSQCRRSGACVSTGREVPALLACTSRVLRRRRPPSPPFFWFTAAYDEIKNPVDPSLRVRRVKGNRWVFFLLWSEASRFEDSMLPNASFGADGAGALTPLSAAAGPSILSSILPHATMSTRNAWCTRWRFLVTIVEWGHGKSD